MGVDTLTSIAQRAAARFSAGIESIGDLPWRLVRPIILRITSPEKLYCIEQASPQIIGLDEECWLSFLRRDIPNFENRPHRPSDPKNWYKVYKKLKKEAEAEMASGAERLKAAYASIKQEKEQNLAKMTTKVVMPARRINTHAVNRSGWGPSTKNMSASDRIKREVNDTVRARMLRERNQLKLSGHAKASAYNNPTKVAVAPRSMVEEIKKRNASPPPTPVVVRAPVRRPSGPRPPLHGPQGDQRRRPEEAGSGYDLMGDREARLKALQRGKPAITRPPPPPINNNALSLDFLEDDGLFSEDEDSLKRPPPPTVRSQPSNALSPPANRPTRTTSPIPQLGQRTAGVKRKPPPSLFMSSPAKRVKSKVA